MFILKISNEHCLISLISFLGTVDNLILWIMIIYEELLKDKETLF